MRTWNLTMKSLLMTLPWDSVVLLNVQSNLIQTMYTHWQKHRPITVSHCGAEFFLRRCSCSSNQEILQILCNPKVHYHAHKSLHSQWYFSDLEQIKISSLLFINTVHTAPWSMMPFQITLDKEKYILWRF
jgi:hypothetical protein